LGARAFSFPRLAFIVEATTKISMVRWSRGDISEVVLRSQDLTTIQPYLGRMGEAERLHWTDVLDGK